MRLCYCDESGTGDPAREPIAVMAGVVVNAYRMHLAKGEWRDFLSQASNRLGRQIAEFHTKDFYPGKGPWNGTDGETRYGILSDLLAWFAERKHRVVYSSVLKSSYTEAFARKEIEDGLNTPWRFLGFHLVLAIQKSGQRETGTKGHTILVFDNQERERARFADLIARPPSWSDAYYDRDPKMPALDCIVDAPYFADSEEVCLIQLADMAAFILRKHAELASGLVAETYRGEASKIALLASRLVSRSVGRSLMYPKGGQSRGERLYWEHAPEAIRGL